MSARNRELLGLIPASLLVTAGFAGVFIQRSNALSNVSLTYGALFLGLCIAAHVFIRITLPRADPYMFPLVAVLASFGLVMIYRISPTLARQQAQWFVLGLILFAATILLLRDYRKLERYRYIIVVISLGLLVLPRLPGIGYAANGAYLGVRIPGLFVFQPSEFAKIGLVIFLASYLRDTRQVLVQGGRRFLGITLPPIKQFGPVVVIWGLAMATLVVLSDTGSSVMFYGGLLAMLYVATNRVSFVVIGLVAAAIGFWYLGTHIPHIHARVETWLHPLNPRLYHAPLGSYQVANSMFAQSAGGLFGQGFGRAALTTINGGPLLPFPQTDMIYAVITDELGLFGAVAVLITYLLFVARGFKTAMLARDSFSTLLAVGLSAMFALQVFVIVGGVTRVIPLTGVTLPFISYGGSSIVANLVLVALLLLISDRAREAGVSGPIVRLFGVVVVLFALLVFFTSRWTVFEASSLNDNPLNVRTLLDELQIKRGQILADDRTVLAESVPAPQHTWTRFYPTRDLFSQAVGYSIAAQGRQAGLEQSAGPELRGVQTGLDSIFGQLSPRPVGDNVYTTLDPKSQKVAEQELAGRGGSVVALDPRTGAVLTMYANPTYDNNNPDPKACKVPSCLVNNSTQAAWPPGSTFKVVTAAAAIDSGEYTPNSVLDGKSPRTVSGVPLQNDNNQSFGNIDLTTALTYSVNTVWAQVAEHVGRRTMTDYMKRFGFYDKPPLDYPSGQIRASLPVAPNGRPYKVQGSPLEDIGRIGIGQGGLLVTPLQMAMVAAAVANHGTLMKPHFIDKVLDPDGRTVRTVDPSVYHEVMKPSTAQALSQMMRRVVEEGTGTPAQLGGISVAGKTGTASIGTPGSGLTEPWFIGFAPAEDPKVAVAVTIAQTQGGFGGTVAAPIAKAVIQTLLAEGK